MRTLLSGILLLLTFSISCSLRVFAQAVNPRVVAKIVADGKVKFSSTKSTTIWLDSKQKYSIYPVTVESNESHEYMATTQAADQIQTAQAAESSRSDKKSLSAGVAQSAPSFQGGPHPPPPPPPRPPPPVNHGGPRPPLPVPPRPSNRRPTPQPPAKFTAELAAEGAIVGRLVTDGISQSNWKLPKGTYTIVLVPFEGKPVAALVNTEGKYVASLDNIFLLDTSDQNQK
jgi:hypothetical protein